MKTNFSIEIQWLPSLESNTFKWSGASEFENACLSLFLHYEGEMTVCLGELFIPLTIQYDLKGVFLDLPLFLDRILKNEKGPHFLQFATGSGLDMLISPEGNTVEVMIESGDGCGSKYYRYDGVCEYVDRKEFLCVWQKVIYEVLRMLKKVQPEMQTDPDFIEFQKLAIQLCDDLK